MTYLSAILEFILELCNNNVLWLWYFSRASAARSALSTSQSQRRPHTAAGRFMQTPAPPEVINAANERVDKQELSAERPFRYLFFLENRDVCSNFVLLKAKSVKRVYFTGGACIKITYKI